MAIAVTVHCLKCRQEKQQMIGGGAARPHICRDCERAEADAERTKFLAELKGLPLEERIARLEAWAYDYVRENGETLHRARLANMRF